MNQSRSNHIFRVLSALIIMTVAVSALFLTESAFASAPSPWTIGTPINGNVAIITEGVGTDATGSGTFSITVPAGSTVLSASILWGGLGTDDEMTLSINAGAATTITADESYETEWGCCGFELSSYIADISSLITSSGTNSYTVDGFDFSEDWGATIMVVYENPMLPEASYNFQRGADGFFIWWADPNGPHSEVRCQSFAAASYNRAMDVEFITGGVSDDLRPNAIWYQAGTGAQPTQVITQSASTEIAGYEVAPVGEWPLISELGAEWDEYEHTVTVPAGATWACFQIESDNDYLFTLGGGPNPDNNYLAASIAWFGFNSTIENEPSHGAIGNYIWLDENNDGVQDAGEMGIPNVTVTMVDGSGNEYTATTDANGGYLFPNLVEGYYTVSIDESQAALSGMNYTVGNAAGQDFGNQDPSGYLILLGEDEVNLSADFGFNHNTNAEVNGNTGNAAIGDRVWVDSDGDGAQDPDEQGVSGVEITLYDADGNALQTTLTDANGNYLFDNLTPGAYSVAVTSHNSANHFILGSGYNQTGDPEHFGTTGTNNDNQSDLIVLAPGDVFVNADFGYQPTASANLNTIGDTIWLDEDASGTQNGGEEGIAGVTVSLIDNAGSIIATTVTDENGEYLFEDVPDGVYTVWVNDANGVLANLDPTFDNDGGFDNMSSVAVSNGATNLQQDFGYTPVGNDGVTGMIGDTVWFDANNNGAQDPDEGGIGGVTVILTYPGGGTTTTVTDANGQYWFTGLPVDGNGETYTISVDPSTLPTGVTQTYDDNGTGTANTSTATLTTGNPVDLDQDFGYRGVNRLGNLVWQDSNADGVYDANGADNVNGTDDDEPLLAGVTVDLYYDADGSMTFTAGDSLIATETTAASASNTAGDSGNYLFTNLPDGKYFVVVSDDAGVVNGYWSSLGTAGATNNGQMTPYMVDLDSANANSGTTTNITADFGYYVEPASLGNYVWIDTDGDGIQDSNENGIAGATVTMMIMYPNGTMVTLETTSASDGSYSFDNLLFDEDFNGDGAGSEPTYSIKMTPPTGYVSTTADQGNNDLIDSDDPAGTDAEPVQGQTDVSNLTNPANEPDIASYDFGVVEAMAIGNMVFADDGAGSNKNNGKLDGDESGINGVAVTLYRDNGDGTLNTGTDEVVGTTTTANGGLYVFDNLPPGKYFVHIDASNFLPGGALYDNADSVPLSSSSGSSTGTGDQNVDENGIDSGDPQSEGIASALIMLMNGGEPVNDLGNDPANHDDDNTNLTIDFGFFVSSATAVTLVENSAETQSIAAWLPVLVLTLALSSMVAVRRQRVTVPIK